MSIRLVYYLIQFLQKPFQSFLQMLLHWLIFQLETQIVLQLDQLPPHTQQLSPFGQPKSIHHLLHSQNTKRSFHLVNHLVQTWRPLSFHPHALSQFVLPLIFNDLFLLVVDLHFLIDKFLCSG